MNNKKIKLFLGGYINDANAQNINCLALYKYLDKHKFELLTLTRSGGKINIDSIKDNGKIINYNNKFKFTKIWIYVYALYKCDVLYLPKQEKLKVILILNKLFKKKLFLTIEGIINDYSLARFPTKGKRSFKKYLANINVVEYVYSISEFMRTYNQKIGLKSKKQILYLGMDSSCFVPKKIVMTNINHIIFIGNDMARKGIDEYIKLSNFFQNITFHIVGRGNKEHLENIKEQYSNIVIHGSLNPEALNNLLQTIDLHILPSKTEGFPKVILETAAVGVPSLIYSHYGASEWMTSDYDGFIVDNIADMHSKLDLLTQDQKLLFEVANHSVELSKRFTWEEVIKKWDSEIQHIYGNAL